MNVFTAEAPRIFLCKSLIVISTEGRLNRLERFEQPAGPKGAGQDARSKSLDPREISPFARDDHKIILYVSAPPRFNNIFQLRLCASAAFALHFCGKNVRSSESSHSQYVIETAD